MPINVTNAVAVLNNASSIANDCVTLAIANSKMRVGYANLKAEIAELSEIVKMDTATLEDMVKASAILASVSEENTKIILDNIKTTINKSLEVLFPLDPKTVDIQKSMYRDTHPHYTITLTTSNGVARTFEQSGTGLGQVISFLFTVCLIDARDGRKIMVIDELLNGLHPDAKAIVGNLMTALTRRQHNPFQFICVEYGLDIGKQYEIKKDTAKTGLSTASIYEGTGYYKDLGGVEE
jgi:hypothetical protein